jgi:hypothetical protein
VLCQQPVKRHLLGLVQNQIQACLPLQGQSPLLLATYNLLWVPLLHVLPPLPQPDCQPHFLKPLCKQVLLRQLPSQSPRTAKKLMH